MLLERTKSAMLEPGDSTLNITPKPLRELLRRVHAEVIVLGVREHVLVATLWQSHPPGELRAAIASVLATEPQQWDEIARRFDECIPKHLLTSRERAHSQSQLANVDAAKTIIYSAPPFEVRTREDPTRLILLGSQEANRSDVAPPYVGVRQRFLRSLHTTRAHLAIKLVSQLNRIRAAAWVPLLVSGVLLLSLSLTVLFVASWFLHPATSGSLARVNSSPTTAAVDPHSAPRGPLSSKLTNGSPARARTTPANAGPSSHSVAAADPTGMEASPPEAPQFQELTPPRTELVSLSMRPRPLAAAQWLWLALLVALLSLVGFRWALLPRHVRRMQFALIRKQEAEGHAKLVSLAETELKNPRIPRRLYHFEPILPFDRTVLEDSAGLLGRTYRQCRGLDLDIDASLRATIEAGGRALPIYVPYRRMREILILIDFESGGNPWLSGFLRVVEFWQRQGIPLTVLRFSRRPDRLQSLDSRQSLALHDLARTHDGAAVLLFSRNLSISGITETATGQKELASWPEDLLPWSLRVWLDPDPRPLSERHPEQRRAIVWIEQHGLTRFPYTADGLLAFARYVAAEGIGVVPPQWPSLPSASSARLRAALKRWAAVAALVPDASWDQLEVFRMELPALQRELGDSRYVQRLIEFLSERLDEPADLGDALLVPPEEEDRLIRSLRAETEPSVAALEGQARRVLLAQLGPAPKGDREGKSLDYWRWLLKVNGHLAILYPQRDIELYVPLLGSPVDAQARAQLRQELRRQALPQLRLRRLVGLSSDLMLRELLRGQPTLWRRAALLTASVVALSLTLIWTVPWLTARLNWLCYSAPITFPATLTVQGLP